MRIARLEERTPGTGERVDLIDAFVNELAAQAKQPGEAPAGELCGRSGDTADPAHRGGWPAAE